MGGLGVCDAVRQLASNIWCTGASVPRFALYRAILTPANQANASALKNL